MICKDICQKLKNKKKKKIIEEWKKNAIFDIKITKRKNFNFNRDIARLFERSLSIAPVKLYLDSEEDERIN